MNKVVFGIVGGGWRTEFYLRIARGLPDRFDICGLVVRDLDKGKALEAKWGVRTYQTIEELLEATNPTFMVVSVGWEAAPMFTSLLVERGIPVLSETPPAPDLSGLIELNKLTEKGGRIQVAEQYHLQPLHAARLNLANSGLLGEVSQAQVSVCHGYHAMSLIRRFLGLKFENATITAHSFSSPLLQNPERQGSEMKHVNSKQIISLLDFDGKLGLFDFTDDQYFSWVRALRLTIRGEIGEIVDQQVRYLKEERLPIDIELKRCNAGENGNLEGYFLKGILAGDQWVYENPFIPGRLSDDEIAIASCLVKMDIYAKGGPDFYSLAEASQDHYLAMMMNRAASNNEKVRTESQPWTY
ncbi:MAG: Gfo/Idh/MocA family oxidoreductase [Vallitaleaceae bacterium]|nr:Gfo/Idh/MocA family oxidoreductase [Vallitaleaceae bacterium]